MNAFLNVWASFTDAEREIILLVFCEHRNARKRAFESAIAEDIYNRLFDDLWQLEGLKYEREQQERA